MTLKNIILQRKFITPAGIQKIREHKYKGGTYTYLDNKMNHFWFWTLQFFPKTLAPNAITLIGFLTNISSMLLILSFTQNLSGEIPNWVFYYFSLTLFLYQTFDAVDGKQARRLNLSSPLGQLFDHGCDACLSFFLVLTSLFILRAGENPFFVRLSLISCIFTFYFANWAEFFTGVLKTNNYGLGVTELQFFFIIMSAVTGACGRDIYEVKVLFWDLRSFVLVLISGVSVLCVFPMVFEAFKKAKVKSDFFRMFFPIFFIVLGIMFLITDKIEGYMVLGYFMSSFAYVTNVIKIIVSSMSHMRFKTFHFESYFFFLVSFIIRFGGLGNFGVVFMLFLGTGVLFANFMSLALSIIFQISEELNIKILTV